MKYRDVHLNEYGFYELDDKPTLEQRKKEFEEKYFQNSMSSYEQEYSDDELKYFTYKLEQKEWILIESLKKNNYQVTNDPVITMLDIGCGEGFALDYFDKAGWNVTGIDFSHYGVEHHHPEQLKHLLCGDCMVILPQLASEGRRYDVINIDSALDMMLEPAKTIEMCKSLLNDNGVVLAKVANNYTKLQRKLLEDGKLQDTYWLDKKGHPWYFNKNGLIGFFEKVGYRCLDFLGESFIDFNLVNPDTNYYEKNNVGKNCYKSKVYIENMLHEESMEKTLQVYRTLGEMGFGREMIGVFGL